ncbi:MAG: hypothetical protein A2Y62_06840 [Candidatus Fischerbacteria bacterium RBG_13_37_8]|uniref:DUF948 domain-containing protein n=1 Tax=Candidatus Fischerbacteria bacterium RBG_13_37_8 TaxID=1817863 RepID=A0A1F5VME4_9BACT|nr:MAG: hypothetical protein A2Y62_06840 [Candidatus Fischerbacteria bacterium RBG_13_37_8]
MQDNFYYLLSLGSVILIFVLLFLAHAFYHTLLQIKNTARTIEKAIQDNQELFDNLKELSSRLNEQVAELSPVIEELNATAKKVKEMKQGLLNSVFMLSSLTHGYLGKLPAFLMGMRWIIKKFRKGGR